MRPPSFKTHFRADSVGFLTHWRHACANVCARVGRRYESWVVGKSSREALLPFLGISLPPEGLLPLRDSVSRRNYTSCGLVHLCPDQDTLLPLIQSLVFDSQSGPLQQAAPEPWRRMDCSRSNASAVFISTCAKMNCLHFSSLQKFVTFMREGERGGGVGDRKDEDAVGKAANPGSSWAARGRARRPSLQPFPPSRL